MNKSKPTNSHLFTRRGKRPVDDHTKRMRAALEEQGQMTKEQIAEMKAEFLSKNKVEIIDAKPCFGYGLHQTLHSALAGIQSSTGHYTVT